MCGVGARPAVRFLEPGNALQRSGATEGAVGVQKARLLDLRASDRVEPDIPDGIAQPMSSADAGPSATPPF